MKKQQKSKLDPYSEKLEQWFGEEHVTLAEACRRLHDDHSLSVSPALLSAWWEKRQSEQLQEKLLDRIATGAEMVKKVEKQFATDAPPSVETLVALHRTLIMQLTMQSTADPGMLRIATKAMTPVMAYLKVQEQRADREVEERRVRLLEEKAAEAKQKLNQIVSKEKAGLTPEALKRIEEAAALL